ncbi:hypothetical protein [Pusillimonas sp.]|uniref:hypothetical protein n=1 Tax=Pusillimonas sp. TaxID=3040095 RepID=UPI0029A6695B|nr:hypothetical protein [Pusillimonas sp.]MDX3896300.1 hypothetical protein [Pusillimonas sp.]
MKSDDGHHEKPWLTRMDYKKNRAHGAVRASKEQRLPGAALGFSLDVKPKIGQKVPPLYGALVRIARHIPGSVPGLGKVRHGQADSHQHISSNIHVRIVGCLLPNECVQAGQQLRGYVLATIVHSNSRRKDRMNIPYLARTADRKYKANMLASELLESTAVGDVDSRRHIRLLWY